MIRSLPSLVLCVALGGVVASALAADRPSPPKAGREFQSPATQAMQDDDTTNPGMLWVDQGAKLWVEPSGTTAKSCASCHGDAVIGMKGVAARLPAVDPLSGRLVNLEARIIECRTQRQGAKAPAHESQELLSLTAFVSLQSRGLPRSIAVDGAAKPYFERGRAFWQTRQGQMNLACSQCHDDSVGKRLRGDTISEGHSQGWPGYRLDWQGMGSLHRRLRACSLGVRAEILDYGSPDYLALELYLAWRGGALPMESPGVRR